LRQLCWLFCKHVSFKIFEPVGGPYGQPLRAAGWKPLVRRTLDAYLNGGAFHYDTSYDYTFHPSVVMEKWINYACIAVLWNLKMKHQECAARVEKWNCRNYIQHPNQYQIWYQVAQANRNISWQIQLHANIQIASANLSSCWLTITTTGCRSQISSNLFHGKHWWTNQPSFQIQYRH